MQKPRLILYQNKKVPSENTEALRTALFNAGAGNIGNYDSCSFNLEGKGTYRGNEESNPTLGKKGELHKESETLISVVFTKHLETKVLKALFNAHPYEEVAYEITTLDNTNQYIGMGMIGDLEQEMEELDCLKYVKQKMNTECVRHSKFLNKPIKKIAVLGGSGSFAIRAAKASGADLLVTADLKYHDFFSAENNILLADIGHYESEQFTKSFLVDYLSKKITNFAVVLSKTNTNPVKYL